jgi:hypothetical protein
MPGCTFRKPQKPVRIAVHRTEDLSDTKQQSVDRDLRP